MKDKELLGIQKGGKFYLSEGEMRGIPYEITEEKNGFLLNQRLIGFGIGPLLSPVAFFDKEYEGVYKWKLATE